MFSVSHKTSGGYAGALTRGAGMAALFLAPAAPARTPLDSLIDLTVDSICAVQAPLIVPAHKSLSESDIYFPFDADIVWQEPVVDPSQFADSLLAAVEQPRFTLLTDEDYKEVADELGIEVAAMKAVVEIEAGKSHKGFWAPGKPLINFDLTIYRKFAPRHNVSLSKAKKRSPEIFRRPDAARYGSYQAAQQARLDAAAAIDSLSAFESTFWGMFQIGGFNWRKCGVADVVEFVRLMSRSERDQLELFARFITNSGMVEYIRKRDWLRFALKYNGPKARSRGYHTRLAAAYRRHRAG